MRIFSQGTFSAIIIKKGEKMKKFLFIYLIIFFSLTYFSSCATMSVYDQNVLDFSRGDKPFVSTGIIGYFYVPYRLYISFSPAKGHRLSFDLGEREFGGSYIFKFARLRSIDLSTGINYHGEQKKGMRITAEKDSSSDEEQIPFNELIEVPISMTYLKNKVMGWISVKPGLWIIDKYKQEKDGIVVSNGQTQYEYIAAQQKGGVTVEGGFGYYDPDGFMALVVFNKPFYILNGEVMADNFLGIIAGINFSLE